MSRDMKGEAVLARALVGRTVVFEFGTRSCQDRGIVRHFVPAGERIGFVLGWKRPSKIKPTSREHRLLIEIDKLYGRQSRTPKWRMVPFKLGRFQVIL